MQKATRLTRLGDLSAATSAIQKALAGATAFGSPAARRADVSDTLDSALLESPARGSSDSRRTDESFVEGVFESAAGRCDYWLYQPAAADARLRPLLVMLHGCSQTPLDFASGTGMNDVARKEGFLVLYPAQSRSANPQGCWNWFRPEHQGRDAGEPALLAALTQSIASSCRVDAERIYVAGLSAGGAMAAILGETYPDIFAAVGVHSGLAARAAGGIASALSAMQGLGIRADGASGVPSIVFHGDADNTVDASNGEQVISAAVGDAPCAVEEHQENGRSYSRTRYQTKNGRVMAERWSVHGAGHAWSGGTTEGSFSDPEGPSASAEMARFLLQQRRRRAPPQ